jgi:integrase
MQGHVRQRGKRSWEYIADVGMAAAERCASCGRRFWVERKTRRVCPKCAGKLIETEERRRQTKAGFPTRKAAQAAMNKLLVSVEEKSYTPQTKLTLREYLKNEWLPSIEATIRPSSFRAYKQHVRCHVCPHLGSVQLQKLSGSQINALYAKLALSGKQDGKRGLSPLTIRHVHATLHRALKDAVRWERLSRNPIDAADPPRISGDGTRELKTWSAVQLRAFLDFTSGERLSSLWHVLAMTGMRRGESLGLRWEDVDLEAGRLAVRRALIPNGAVVVVSEPKTAKGRRTVALDPETVEALKRQAARQLEDQAKKEEWRDTGLVFTKEDGEAWHPEVITRFFGQAVTRSKLPRIRLHDLRHTHATLALRAGIHPKVVSERLGHATISITLDTYSHAIPAMQEEAAVRIAELVFART